MKQSGARSAPGNFRVIWCPKAPESIGKRSNPARETRWENLYLVPKSTKDYRKMKPSGARSAPGKFGVLGVKSHKIHKGIKQSSAAGIGGVNAWRFFEGLKVGGGGLIHTYTWRRNPGFPRDSRIALNRFIRTKVQGIRINNSFNYQKPNRKINPFAILLFLSTSRGNRENPAI